MVHWVTGSGSLKGHQVVGRRVVVVVVVDIVVVVTVVVVVVVTVKKFNSVDSRH